jgi:hypothetical protein
MFRRMQAFYAMQLAALSDTMRGALSIKILVYNYSRTTDLTETIWHRRRR